MHFSHDIQRVPPRHTSAHQRPVAADHEQNVHLNPSRTKAVLLNGRRGRSDRGALEITYEKEGGNVLLDPPALVFTFVGHVTSAMVTVESLLYALAEMGAPASALDSREG